MNLRDLSPALPSPAAAPPRIAAWKWQVVWLMFLATMINYMDRQTMQSTSSYIMEEFKLGEEGYGWIEFAFGISYALFQIFAGSLADRLNIRWLYAMALLVWSAAGFLTGFAQTVALLMTCRVVLGIGEAFNWPCAVTVVRRLLPHESRSLANGIFHSGTSIGAATTPLLVAAMVGADGEHWRLVFMVVGAVGLVWVALWFWCVHGQRAAEVDHPTIPDPGTDSADPPPLARIPFWHVFGLRTFWIALAVSTAVNIFWHFYRVWLPRLLVRERGFNPQDMQYVLAGFYVAADLGSMTAGYLTRVFTRAGLSVERARKIVLIVTSLLCLFSIPAALVASVWIAIPLILIVAAGALGGFPILFALTQDISSQHTARCVGLIGALAWFLIAALNPLVGGVVDRIGTFVPLLLVVGLVPLAGALVGLLWPEQPKSPKVVTPG